MCKTSQKVGVMVNKPIKKTIQKPNKKKNFDKKKYQTTNKQIQQTYFSIKKVNNIIINQKNKETFNNVNFCDYSNTTNTTKSSTRDSDTSSKILSCILCIRILFGYLCIIVLKKRISTI